MPTLKIEYQDNDATPDHIAALAKENGTTPEDLVKRAINEYLGVYGLKELPENFRPQTLNELFGAAGLTKPEN